VTAAIEGAKMIDPESIEVGGVYRTMEASWMVEEIVDGKVDLKRDDGKLARFGLEHFAQIVERRVTPIEGGQS